MAEGFLRHYASELYEVFSAGITPSEVNSFAVTVMKEVGIDISHQQSKSVDSLKEIEFDLIITVCDHAKESCPIFHGQVEYLHWSFEDPADYKGTNEQLLSVFRTVRDQIRNKIQSFL